MKRSTKMNFNYLLSKKTKKVSGKRNKRRRTSKKKTFKKNPSKKRTSKKRSLNRSNNIKKAGKRSRHGKKKRSYKIRKMVGGEVFDNITLAKGPISKCGEGGEHCLARVYIFDANVVTDNEGALEAIAEKHTSRDLMFLVDKNWQELTKLTTMRDLGVKIGYPRHTMPLNAVAYMLIIKKNEVSAKLAIYDTILDEIDGKYRISNALNKHKTPLPDKPLGVAPGDYWKTLVMDDVKKYEPSRELIENFLLPDQVDNATEFSKAVEGIPPSHMRDWLDFFIKAKSGVNRLFSNTGILKDANMKDTGMLEVITNSNNIQSDVIHDSDNFTLFKFLESSMADEE